MLVPLLLEHGTTHDPVHLVTADMCEILLAGLTMANPTVNFLGYNSTGIDKQKCAWLRDLCDLTDATYVTLQEHFKIVKTTDKFLVMNLTNTICT